MTHSINHPAAISDKFRNKYGNLLADLDFEFLPKISNEIFQNDPYGTVIGYLKIAGRSISFKYKDLIEYSKLTNTLINRIHSDQINKTDTINISIKGHDFDLNRAETTRLYETITDSMNSTLKGYELGLYL